MRRLSFYFTLCILILFGVGCKEKEVLTLSASEVETNTILVGEDGVIQSALVEDFDKEYYDTQELKSFAEEQISKYNKGYGADSIVLHSIDKKKGSVCIVLTYQSIEDYARFNEIEADILTTSEANSNNMIPDEFTSMSNNESITKEKALEDDSYSVLVVNENLDIVISGKIKCFTNGLKLNNNTIQSNSDGKTMLVYK